ncbi:MAG: hypothetical protein ACNA8W_00515 [Bradymonadaceae bacterium]
MTIGEARRAYTEMVVDMDASHAREVRRMLEEAEQKSEDRSQKTDKDV